MAKRAEGIYDLFREELSEIRNAESEERIKAFFKVIEFENADEILKRALRIVDEKQMSSITLKKIYQASQFKDEYGWLEYLKTMEKAFKEWRHSEEVKEKFGKPTGVTDLLRAYKMI